MFTLSGTLLHSEDYSGTMKRDDGSTFDYAGTRLSVLVEMPETPPEIVKVKVATEDRGKVATLGRGEPVTLGVAVRPEVSGRGVPRLTISFVSVLA